MEEPMWPERTDIHIDFLFSSWKKHHIKSATFTVFAACSYLCMLRAKESFLVISPMPGKWLIL